MMADSNAIIHPSTKGVNVPAPFTSLHEINTYNFKKKEFIFQFFDEDRDKNCYVIKVDVQTHLMPIELSKKLKDFLMKAKTWLKHPSITYNRMKPIALVKNTKQGIHSETKFQRVLVDEFVAYFSGRADKQFSGNKLKVDIEGWAPEYKVPKIEVVYEEVCGIQQGAEMMTIKVPELHHNHAMNILRNNLNLFGTQYELLHMAAMKELKNETVFIKGRNYNKFDTALISHKKNIDRYHIVTIDHLPATYKSITLQGEKDGLRPGAIPRTLGQYLTENTNVISIEETEIPGRYHIVLMKDAKENYKEFGKSLSIVFEKTNGQADHPLSKATKADVNASTKLLTEAGPDNFTSCGSAWLDFSLMTMAPTKECTWADKASGRATDNFMIDANVYKDDFFAAKERAQMLNDGHEPPPEIKLPPNGIVRDDVSFSGETTMTRQSFETMITAQVSVITRPILQKVEALQNIHTELEERHKQQMAEQKRNRMAEERRHNEVIAKLEADAKRKAKEYEEQRKRQEAEAKRQKEEDKRDAEQRHKDNMDQMEKLTADNNKHLKEMVDLVRAALVQGQNQNTNNNASITLPTATQTTTGSIVPSVQAKSPNNDHVTTPHTYFTLDNSQVIDNPKMSEISVKTPGTASTLTHNTQMTQSSVEQLERDQQMQPAEKIYSPPHIKKHSRLPSSSTNSPSTPLPKRGKSLQATKSDRDNDMTMNSVDEVQIDETSNNNGSQVDNDGYSLVKKGASPHRINKYPLRNWKPSTENPFEVLNGSAGARRNNNNKK